ncbi:hypothetical protein HPT25_21870 [Bacillus sp. BRMEA1]|uniref:DUF5995 family protein n=1 Tax=Neobacillus endophyticus TaxID=2738405 RepID=UPI00156456BB|nr:DUF5995 family protein [Neobacillus endophyticus]NRD79987.1 hypothetical protein [Neobacillus endophyticus]
MNRLIDRIRNAKTIDEVIWQLDEIISLSKQSKSKIGYFASLYRMVTVNQRILNEIWNF